jgi:uncharacterized protein
MTTNLRIRADEIPNEGRELTIELEPSWMLPLIGPHGAPVGAPTRIRGRLEPVGNKVVARGHVETVLTFECSRCAARASVQVGTDFAHVYAPSSKGKRDDEQSDDGMTFFDGYYFDMAPMIAEELVLAMPDFPLCREDCKGLCARCGAELNEGDCGCQPEVDPRWAKLSQLKL